jgi:hypothetical protein
MESLTFAPSTEDAAAAAMMLTGLDPKHHERLPARIAGLEHELDGLTETARLDSTVSVEAFISRAKRLIVQRNALFTRLERSVPGSNPGALPVAEEIAGKVMAVRRFRDGSQLRSIRAARIEKLRSELAHVENEIQSLQASYRAGNHFVIPHDRAQAGSQGADDAFLDRCLPLITRRRETLMKISALDPFGDVARAKLISAAVEAAGGTVKVVEAIAPTLRTVSVGKSVEAEKRHAGILAKIGSIDPDTELSKQLQGEADELAATLDQTRKAIDKERAEAATAIVSAAVETGRFAAILQLETALAQTALADAVQPLALARGAEADWPSLVADMIRDED